MTKAAFSSLVFSTLKAEDEPWLEHVFVEPQGFDRAMANYSSIVYGDTGYGKTSLCQILNSKDSNRILVVPWTPEPIPSESVHGSNLVAAALEQALQACVVAMIERGDLPRRLVNAPKWALTALPWFLQRYLPFDDPVLYIESQGLVLQETDVKWYVNLLSQPVAKIMKDNASASDQIRLLLSVLKQAKYEGIRVTIDGLEKWPIHTETRIIDMLDAILSTLVVFDIPGIIYKFFVPSSLRETLTKTAGVQRHRVEEILMSWSSEKLFELLNKRLAIRFSNPKFAVTALCNEPAFLEWLVEFGGQNPRAWLKLLRPFVDAYKQKTFTPAMWSEIAQVYPPLLSVRPGRQEVWIGEKCISIASDMEFRILQYLSTRSRQICSLEEIYYCAVENMATVPPEKGDGWKEKLLWRPALDTTIYRIRQKIEKNPQKPIYLLTHPRKGLELTNVQM